MSTDSNQQIKIRTEFTIPISVSELSAWVDHRYAPHGKNTIVELENGHLCQLEIERYPRQPKDGQKMVIQIKPRSPQSRSQSETWHLEIGLRFGSSTDSLLHPAESITLELIPFGADATEITVTSKGSKLLEVFHDLLSRFVERHSSVNDAVCEVQEPTEASSGTVVSVEKFLSLGSSVSAGVLSKSAEKMAGSEKTAGGSSSKSAVEQLQGEPGRPGVEDNPIVLYHRMSVGKRVFEMRNNEDKSWPEILAVIPWRRGRNRKARETALRRAMERYENATAEQRAELERRTAAGEIVDPEQSNHPPP